MAPSNMAAIDCSRYLLRTTKHQSSITKIETADVSSKIDFLHVIGLTRSNAINPCQTCDESVCDCVEQSTGVTNLMNVVRPCWVVVSSEKCTVCGKSFKCQSDLDDHIRQKHIKRSRTNKIRVVSRIGNEIIKERYVKKKYLNLPDIRSSRDQVHSDLQELPDKNIPISFVTPETTEASDSDDSSSVMRLESPCQQEINVHVVRSCSAPSMGTAVQLPVCKVDCNCCIPNIINHQINIISQDQNNNSCNNSNNKDSSISNHDTYKFDEIKLDKSVSHQTSSNWNYPGMTLLEYSRTLEAELKKKDNKKSGTESLLIDNDSDDDIVDITPARNFSIGENLITDESGDCEIEEILRITRKHPVNLIDLTEESENEKKPLFIADAIRALINTENSMQSNGKPFGETMEEYDDDDDNDDVSFELRLSPDDDELIFKKFEQTKIRDHEKDYDEDVSIIPLDPHEKNYTFHVKESDTDYEYGEYIKCSLDKISKKTSDFTEFNEFYSKLESWESQKIDRDRFSVKSVPTTLCANKNSSILIKQELTIDHFTFNSE